MTEASRSQPPELREWFEDVEQQQHASRFGMWLFLTSEVLLFGALFGIYFAYRSLYTEHFLAAAHHNNVTIGTANTFILITSSLLVAWAVHAVRGDKRGVAVASLLGAVALGGVFLILKMVEYRSHFREGIFPGRYYTFQELPESGAKLFFTIYYFLTGLHALHVIGGMTILLVMALRTWRRTIRSEYHMALENGGLYWHLVDVVWIFLWPMLYLAG